MATLYLGLGSNLGDRQRLLRQAVKNIERRIGSLISLSAFHETAPWGFSSPHPFLNAVVCVNTPLRPQDVLFITQDIERELGRTRKSTGTTYADRPIDIDLLFYDDMVLDTVYTGRDGATIRLTLPHPLMHKRRFVMEPLAEIAPDRIHPTLGKTCLELYRALEQEEAAQP